MRFGARIAVRKVCLRAHCEGEERDQSKEKSREENERTRGRRGSSKIHVHWHRRRHGAPIASVSAGIEAHDLDNHATTFRRPSPPPVSRRVPLYAMAMFPIGILYVL